MFKKNKTHKCFWSALWNGENFNPKEEKFQSNVALAVKLICIMTMMKKPSGREKASKFSFRCMLIVFIHGSYIDEGAIWRRLDGHLVRVTVKIADVS